MTKCLGLTSSLLSQPQKRKQFSSHNLEQVGCPGRRSDMATSAPTRSLRVTGLRSTSPGLCTKSLLAFALLFVSYHYYRGITTRADGRTCIPIAVIHSQPGSSNCRLTKLDLLNLENSGFLVSLTTHTLLPLFLPSFIRPSNVVLSLSGVQDSERLGRLCLLSSLGPSFCQKSPRRTSHFPPT